MAFDCGGGPPWAKEPLKPSPTTPTLLALFAKPIVAQPTDNKKGISSVWGSAVGGPLALGEKHDIAADVSGSVADHLGSRYLLDTHALWVTSAARGLYAASTIPGRESWATIVSALGTVRGRACWTRKRGDETSARIFAICVNLRAIVSPPIIGFRLPRPLLF